MLFILRFFGDSWPWVATRYCQDWSVVRWSWSSWNVWHSGTNEWKDETSQMPGELSNQQLCEDRSTCKNQYKKTRRIKVKSHILVSITRQQITYQGIRDLRQLKRRDLGVIVDKSLKSSRQCAKAAAAANAVLGMICRTFLCKDKESVARVPFRSSGEMQFN